MIPKLAKGGGYTAGLLAYLYGPGQRDEHEDPRMVAAWAPWVGDPARSAGVSVGDLALLLDAPVHALPGGVPPEHVYHVAVRLAPEDPVLTDELWADVARAMMSAAGIAPAGDLWGCRWVAVRHAEDHIHIVATKGRQDGLKPVLRQDIVHMQQAARRFEVSWGLRRLTSGDRTAKLWPTTGEQRKASRHRRAATARDQLERSVRTAAAGAADEQDFFARLGTSGVRVSQRVPPGGGPSTGYSVALPGDRDRSDRAVWFAGSRLAHDLSLPRVRERWQVPIPSPSTPPVALWQTLERDVRTAADRLGVGGRLQGAGDVAALGDLLVLVPAAAPPLAHRRLTDSAAAFERAARAPGKRGLDGTARALFRSSARTLASAAALAGHNDTAAFLGFLLALTTAVAAAQRWHVEQAYEAQAESAGRAGGLLHEALEVSTGAATVGGVRRRAASSPLAEVVAKVLPAHASLVLMDPAWPALRDRLAAVSRAGFDPASVLAGVAARRELGSAQSVAQVLVWRLDGWTLAHRPASASPASPAPGARQPSATSHRASIHAQPKDRRSP